MILSSKIFQRNLLKRPLWLVWCTIYGSVYPASEWSCHLTHRNLAKFGFRDDEY